MQKMLRWSLSLTALMVSSLMTAQDLGKIFQLDPSVAEKYMDNYMEPMVQATGNGLAGGWYNTAKPHKLLGFDLTLSMNAVQIPDADKTFTFTNGEYGSLQLAGSENSAELPTLAGGETNQQLVFEGSSISRETPAGLLNFTPGTAPFEAPRGGFDKITYVPVPTLNLGLGLVKGTEIVGRYGALSYENLSLNLFGGAIKHNIKQWIPGVKLIPFSLSAFVGYTNMSMDIDFDASEDNYSVENGSASIGVTSTTMQVLASKKLAFFTPYVGAGYNIVGGDLDIKGNYSFTGQIGQVSRTIPIADPVTISEFSGGSTFRATAGFRLKFGVITFHADYTSQKYNTITAGLGVSLR